MKQRKLVVDRIWEELGFFRSSRKPQSQKTGSYMVTASLPISYGYYVTLLLRPIKLEKETLYQDIIRSAGKKEVLCHTPYIYFKNPDPTADL